MYSRNWKSRNGRRKNVATFHSKWNRWVSQSRGQKKKSLPSLSFVLTADRWARGPTPRKKISFSAPLPRLSGKLMIQTDTEIQFDLIPKFRVNVNRSTSFIATNVGSVQSRSGADLSQPIRSVADVYASLVL